MPLPAHHQNDEPLILHVVSYDVSRGAERYARALVDTLDGQGVGHHVLLTLFEGDEESLGADFALDVPRGPLRRGGLDPRVVGRLRKVLRDQAPAAIVAHGGEPAKYAALATRDDIPFVYLVIGSSHPLLSNPLRRRMRDFYVGRAAAVVTVSSALADEMRTLGVPESRLHVIPNGRDPDTYTVPERAPRTTPRAIFIGHLDEQKRPMLFLSVVGEVMRRGVALEAVVVGGGPLLGEVAAAAEEIAAEVLGPREDVPELLAGADLLVLTSRPPEGMPGVLIEAGMSGLASVATDVPGARDVVVDGVTGLIVGTEDEAGLISAVEKLAGDPRLRSTMGAAARERCVREFSLAASAQAWTAVLRGVAA